jgi:hypothetical protein
MLEVHTASIVGASLMIEAVSTETSVSFYQTTLRNIPESTHRQKAHWLTGTVWTGWRRCNFRYYHLVSTSSGTHPVYAGGCLSLNKTLPLKRYLASNYFLLYSFTSFWRLTGLESEISPPKSQGFLWFFKIISDVSLWNIQHANGYRKAFAQMFFLPPAAVMYLTYYTKTYFVLPYHVWS